MAPDNPVDSRLHHVYRLDRPADQLPPLAAPPSRLDSSQTGDGGL
jgi:hypothetical protein